MADEKISFSFDVIRNNLIGALKNAQDQADALGKKFGGISGALSGVGGVWATVAAAIGGVTFARVVEEALQAEENINKMNIALKQSGIYTDSASEELKAYAENLGNITKFSDDAYLATIALTASLTDLSPDQIKQVATASANLATVLGIDLESANRLVVKAIEGNASALTRYGIEIQKGKTATEKFNNTLDALAKFNGAAEKAADSFSGRLSILTNSVGNLFESIGGIVTQGSIVKNTFKFITDQVNDLTSNIEGLKSSIGRAEFLSAVSGTLSSAFKAAADLTGSSGLQKISDQYLRISDSQRQVAQSTQDSKDAQNKLLEESQKAANEEFKRIKENERLREEASKKREEDAKKQIQVYQKIQESLQNIGKTEEQIAGEKFQKTIADLQKSKDLGITVDPSLAVKVNQEYILKLEEIDKKRMDAQKQAWEKENADRLKFIDELKSNPLKDVFKDLPIDKIKVESAISPETLARTEGILAAVGRGQEGARNLISQSLQSIPVFGGIASQLFNIFSRGPDFVREIIRGFVKAAPEFINAIVESIPVFIEELIKAIPYLIDSIIQGFIKVFFDPNFAVTIAIAFGNAFIEAVPRIAQALIDGIKGSIGLGDGGFLSDVGDFFGLAKGGVIAKGGSPGKDSIPALLQPGELVVDKKTTDRLKSDIYDNGGLNNELLVRMISLLERPIRVESSIQLNQREFANIILNLNRTNVRLA